MTINQAYFASINSNLVSCSCRSDHCSKQRLSRKSYMKLECDIFPQCYSLTKHCQSLSKDWLTKSCVCLSDFIVFSSCPLKMAVCRTWLLRRSRAVNTSLESMHRHWALIWSTESRMYHPGICVFCLDYRYRKWIHCLLKLHFI